ncbi:hypothetical protein GCM10009555_027950 [Acrocarpospora macrocephala]|uniref:Uncharacterized protein n=1 Tax=Acrocarpospora macrocephala TaxID=150177 RepID=A0A5M3XDT1_9ACTN|nr:hypothetical protein Amac_106710 [Acrocarpospora macrocephala]
MAALVITPPGLGVMVGGSLRTVLVRLCSHYALPRALIHGFSDKWLFTDWADADYWTYWAMSTRNATAPRR